MLMGKSVPILAVWMAVMGQVDAVAAGPEGQKEAVRIVILGDSTVCDYPPESPVRGWGQYLADSFKGPVAVRNLAVNGRSTKTFLKEGRLQKALDEKADVALIQFGHNDSHGKGRPEATDADTDYKDNLRTYVDAFAKAGTLPVLVTPMHRRTFQDGKVTEELKPYADAMKAVAAERKVAVVDLYAQRGPVREAGRRRERGLELRPEGPHALLGEGGAGDGPAGRR
jgi:lysophospholipase L1-like esterase